MEPSIESPRSIEAAENRERNWVPLAVAVVLVLLVVALALVMTNRPRHSEESTVGASSPDPYAANLQISNLAMSESANLAGGKVTYLDGHIANAGDRTVTEAVVEVIFRDYANKVAQSQKMPLTLVRMREPYIDTVLLSAAPLKPGAQQDFRLIFDAVSPDWAGALPEVRILRISLK